MNVEMPDMLRDRAVLTAQRLRFKAGNHGLCDATAAR